MCNSAQRRVYLPYNSLNSLGFKIHPTKYLCVVTNGVISVAQDWIYTGMIDDIAIKSNHNKRSCGKVMFSLVSVCPWGGGYSPPGVDMTRRRELTSWVGTLTQPSPTPGYMGHGILWETVNQRMRYASYWNAFLFHLCSQ